MEFSASHLVAVHRIKAENVAVSEDFAALNKLHADVYGKF